MSQGNQYNQGLYISEYLRFGREIQSRLDYTGLTRFRKHCTFVLPPKWGDEYVPPLAANIPMKKIVMYINDKPQF